MLLPLLGAVAYPFVTKSVSKTSSIRGGLFGGLVAIAIGLILPGGMMSTQRTEMTPLQVQTSGEASSPFTYNVLMLDEARHVTNLDLTTSNSTVTVSDKLNNNEVRIYRGTSTFRDSWMWLVGITIPTTHYEIEVPAIKAHDYAASSGSQVVLYTSPEFSPTTKPVSTVAVATAK